MGTAYYYFAASLPMVHWDGKLPMPPEEYLSTAGRLLSAKDYQRLKRVFHDEGEIAAGNAVARAWGRFSRDLRNQVAVLRARKKHQDPRKSIRGTMEEAPSLKETVQQASNMDDLLQAQKALDRACWEFIEELAAGHYYDFEFLLCYGLKLNILARHEAYRSPKGREVFEDIKTAELPVAWEASGV